jgi:uncharacterized protein YsxB (DUF464 family)
MIHITIFQNQGKISSFNCIGHAEYAEAGSDVVCAGVSALVINAINSIERLTDTDFSLVTDDESNSGLIDVTFNGELSSEAKLLMDSMILGLQGIQKDYGDEFLKVDFKEV